MKAQLVPLAVSILLLPSALAKTPTLPPSCGPVKPVIRIRTSKHDHPPIAVAPGSATLVFVQRIPVCTGCSAGRVGVTRIGIDGSWVGGNEGNSYFAVTVTPGEHHVCAYWDTLELSGEDKLWLTDLTAQLGHTYYYKVEVLPDWEQRQPMLRLKALQPDEANFLISGSSFATLAHKNP